MDEIGHGAKCNDGQGTVADPFAVPSEWVRRWAHLFRPKGRVLDLACGGGRHSRFLLARGHRVTAIDRNIAGLAGLADERLTVIEADLETGSDWPLPMAGFDGIVVTNYLHRPTLDRLVPLLAPEGALIYETYGAGHGDYGRPASPGHLLLPGELLDVFAWHFTVVAYEHGLRHTPSAVIQRIAAVRDRTVNPL